VKKFVTERGLGCIKKKREEEEERERKKKMDKCPK